jgi:hypothetical protein
LYKDENEKLKWKDEILTKHFGDRKIFQISALDIEEFKKERKQTPGRGKDKIRCLGQSRA